MAEIKEEKDKLLFSEDFNFFFKFVQATLTTISLKLKNICFIRVRVTVNQMTAIGWKI